MGSEVWLNVEDPSVVWVRALVESDADGSAVTVRRRDNSATVTLSAAEFAKLSLAAPLADEPVDDLTSLGEMSDATSLESLRRRYAVDDIYTAIGPVIISVNPYKPVSGCSSEAISRLCKEGDAAPPHVVRVSTIAFNGLVSEKRAQSILISGESGAGKTEACKLCLLALAELSHSSGAATEAALESAVLLEAFGNAKTVYNDNSSRFGKWCAVYFDRYKYHITSCQSQVYLLEKTRIVSAPKGERNYHIFYQMLKGTTGDERRALRLLSGPTDYAYTRDGEYTIDGVDDEREWRATLEKLELLGVRAESQQALMDVVAATLAIGDLAFAPRSAATEDTNLAVSNRDVLETVCGLLGLVPKDFDAKLTTRTISTGKGSSTYVLPLTAEQCADARDAVAKAVYVEAFEWLVGQLNDAQKGDVQMNSADEESFVGLLDIFGFENFKRNGFEQLCINFTNEKLQGQFMDSLVKLRLAEYKREEIACEHIEFPDNEAQIQLLDHRAQGIFALLDDECSVPKGTEQNYVAKLHAAFLKTHDTYDKPKRAKGGGLAGEKHGVSFPSHGAALDGLAFVVVHYAEQVMYTADGWLDKNRGYLHSELAYVLSQSKSDLVSTLFPMASVDTAKKSTVGSLFRRSLRALSTTMLTTSQNYVRCIKPNGVRKPDAFDASFVLRQLRYTGVASVVKIQRSGYPVSMPHTDFIGRYRCIALTRPDLLRGPPSVVCAALLESGPRLAELDASVNWLGSKAAQVGKTRIFMRDEVVRSLERPRLEATRKAAVALQRRARGRMARRVAAVVHMHHRGVTKVRGRMEALDPTGASDALDVLTAQWGAVSVPLKLSLNGDAPLLPVCQAEVRELELEIEALESGLEAEAEALVELQDALAAATTGKGKDAYVQLKVAIQGAHEVSRGLRPELVEALAAAEEALTSTLAGLGLSPEAAKAALEKLKQAQAKQAETRMSRMLSRQSSVVEEDALAAAEAAAEAAEAAAQAAAEAQAAKDAEAARLAEDARVAAELAAWEAEVQRQAAEKERAHRAMVASLETELVASADGPEPTVTIIVVTLNNDIDTESSVPRQLVGYTEKSTGVVFSDKNAISALRKGGLAQREGLLHVGDTVIAVDATPLKGERVAHVLNARKVKSYELTIARSNVSGTGGPRALGAHSGFLHAVKAKDGANLPLQWPRKVWVILNAKAEIEFRENKRADKPTRVQTLKGCLCKTPVTMLRGQELKQPPVIAALLAQRKFPFTLSWPDGEVDHDLVLAAPTSEDRTEWVRALNKTLKALKEAAPTSGWLMKQGGRRAKTGLASMLSRDKKRWFVLTQPEEGQGATFRYYDSPPHIPSAPARGAVVLNRDATLEVDSESKYPHAFVITSKGENDSRAIATSLAADSKADLGRWMKAIHMAIKASGGRKLAPLRALGRASAAAAQLQKASSQLCQLVQMAKLEQEELKQLRIKQLQEVATHLDVAYDPRSAIAKDKKKLVDLIVAQRATHALEEQLPSSPVPGLTTWGSQTAMHASF